MTSQRLTKGPNELVNMLITFMVSIWKNYWFEPVFSKCKGKKKKKPFPQTNYDVKFYKQIETFIFSLYLSPPEFGNSLFSVILLDKLGRLSHSQVQTSQGILENLRRVEFTQICQAKYVISLWHDFPSPEMFHSVLDSIKVSAKQKGLWSIMAV